MPSFKIVGHAVQEKKVFTIYGRGGHLGHVNWTIYINFGSPFPWRLHMKFGFDWSSVSEKIFENGGQTDA